MTMSSPAEITPFIEMLNISLPNLTWLDPEAIPEPYNHLLVHEGDMTGRLERYHQSGIHLRTLKVQHEPGRLFRQVLLRTEQMETVEFGAIVIHLSGFNGPALQAVLGCRQPLGGILTTFEMGYHSALSGFLSINADVHLARELDINEGTVLYGRVNRLMHDGPHQSGVIAEVIEILPPTQ